MSKHTPGPWCQWRATVRSQLSIRQGGDFGGVYIVERIVNPDDAPLIAAAPDLLAAAKLACLNFDRALVSGNFLGDDEHESWSALSKAIDKAEGRA